MNLRTHVLTGAAPGTRHELQSLHFGSSGARPKAVIQASLHADEAPGMLVAHHLRGLLADLERQDRLRGEIILIPFANPLGLAQELLQLPVGRFDLATGENFNRRYANVVERACELVQGSLGPDLAANVAHIRGALRQACSEVHAEREVDSLRKILLTLAIDADVVLDLHCDDEAVMHLYTATPLWPQVEPLARLLHAEVALLAVNSGDSPFDEACSMIWPRLAARLSVLLGRPVDLPMACTSITVELRGETDVRHELAHEDATALVDYLAHRGVIEGAPTLPPLKRAPRPFSGCMPIAAPHAGVVVFVRDLGAEVKRGERIADLIDPSSGETTRLLSPVDGLLLARENRRYVPAGLRIAKVAGCEPLRSGDLLSP